MLFVFQMKVSTKKKIPDAEIMRKIVLGKLQSDEVKKLTTSKFTEGMASSRPSNHIERSSLSKNENLGKNAIAPES